MKNVFWINPIVFATDILFLATDCKKEDPESQIWPATNLSKTGATLNGTVIANDSSTIVTFEYQNYVSRGSELVWKTVTATQSPVTGTTLTNVSANVTGLSSGTTHPYKVKAENSCGTVYGEILSFTLH